MKENELKSVIIIIPAFNEEVTIAGVVGRCLEVLDKAIYTTTVITVDDGSSDNTVKCASDAGATVVSHSTNRGVGRAFRTGIEAALLNGADIIVNIDADGQFNPADISTLIKPITDNKADFVTASRFKDPSLLPDMPKMKIWGNKMMSIIISKISGKKFYDVSCGFRAYSRKAALHLNLWGDFTYTQETILDLTVKGVAIEEVPLKIEGVREHGPSKVASNLWHYGYKTSKIILRSYLDYWPGLFFGWISLPFLTVGLALILRLFLHRLSSGSFTPHIWAGFTGGALCMIGLITVVIGFVGEILKRIRLNQEMLLYYNRRNFFSKNS